MPPEAPELWVPGCQNSGDLPCCFSFYLKKNIFFCFCLPNMSMFKRVNLYLYKKNVRPLFWSDNFLKFRCTLYCELHTAWFYVDMASVYERALTEKKTKVGTHLIKAYLICVVVDCDEPLALSLCPNLSGFLVRAVFGVFSIAIGSAKPFTYLLMMYCTNDARTNIWTSVDRKRGQTRIY